MLCESCHKNEATVHLTQVINDTVKKVHLCEECAAKSGVEVQSPVALADLLLGLSRAADDAACPKCHLRRSDFKKMGRLGCPACYEAFKEELLPLLKSMHRGVQHTGKTPKNVGAAGGWADDVEVLERQLQRAVAEENFELAAQLRDRLRECRERAEGRGQP
jgi:protein arginine kinase activator